MADYWAFEMEIIILFNGVGNPNQGILTEWFAQNLQPDW